MEEFGILSLIPPIVAIILALTTKDVIISLVSSVAAARWYSLTSTPTALLSSFGKTCSSPS